MNTYFNQAYAGATYKYNGSGSPILYENPGQTIEIITNTYFGQPNQTVTLSGWCHQPNNNTFYFQTIENPELYILIDYNNYTWQKIANAKERTQAEAQKIVNGVIDNNKYILSNNLLCARFANKLTKEQRKMLYALQYRLERRDASLRDTDLFSQMAEAYPEGYAEFSEELEAFMKNPGIGAIPIIAVIIVVALVVGLSATAAYYAYIAYYNESKQDVKYSKELTQTLQQKLTEEEYQQLLQETAGFLTKQRILQQLGSIGSNTKNLLLLSLGFIIALRATKWLKAVQDKPVNTKLLKDK